MGSLALALINVIFPFIAKFIPDATVAMQVRAAITQAIVGGEANAEIAQMENQAKIIIAEVQAEDKIVRLWRPVTAIIFVVMLVILYVSAYFHYIPLPEYLMTDLIDLVKWCLCGYIGGRSLEKAVKSWSDSQSDN